MHPLFAIAAAHHPTAWVPQGARSGALGQQTAYQSIMSAVPLPTAQPMGFAGGALTASDVDRLKNRSLDFQQVLSQVMQLPMGALLTSNDGLGLIAMMAANAVVGDDHEFTTGQPTPGYTEQRIVAAYELVLNNVYDWFVQYYGFNPTPQPKPAQPTPMPVPVPTGP